MRSMIAFVLGNFTLTFFVLGLIASAIALAFSRERRTWPVIIEALFSYFLLFSIAVSYFYNFVFHVFFGEMAAEFIGWADSPFQTEVGFASLGFAVIGLLAFKGSRDMRIAVDRRNGLLPLGSGGGSPPPDGHGTQFRPRQRRHHVSTATSYFRSSASYFCGCSVLQQGKAVPERCVAGALVLEQKENAGRAGSRSSSAVEKDGKTCAGGDLAATWPRRWA